MSLIKLEDHFPMKRYHYMFEENVKNLKTQEEWISEFRNEMNKYCALIIGEPYVICRDFDLWSQGSIYRRRTKSSFREIFERFKYFPYLSDTVQSKRPKLILDLWLEWPGHRMVSGEECDPSYSLDPNVFNLYDGPFISKEMACDVGEVDLQVWLDFIKDIWCGSDGAVFDYVIKWFASIVQNPGVKMNASLVLKGDIIFGRDCIIDIITTIIGRQYFIRPFLVDEILGTANDVLTRKLLIIVNDDYWRKSITKTTALRNLLSQKYIIINGNGQPPRAIANRINMIFSGEVDWVSRVGDCSQKFVTLNLSRKAEKLTMEERSRIKNINIFTVANYLYGVDISNYNPEDMP